MFLTGKSNKIEQNRIKNLKIDTTHSMHNPQLNLLMVLPMVLGPFIKLLGLSSCDIPYCVLQLLLSIIECDVFPLGLFNNYCLCSAVIL